jgi:signal transduction histidine kinase
VTVLRFRSSLALRIALQVAAATAVVGFVLFFFIYSALAEHGRTALTQAIDTDLAGLADIHAAEGTQGLARRITERLDLAPTAAETPWYSLKDGAGRQLAGNLKILPVADAATSPLVTLTTATGATVIVRLTPLKDGAVLAVGRSEDGLRQSLGQLRLLFGSALAVMVAAAFAIGAYGARSLKTRVSNLNQFLAGLTGSMAPEAKVRGDEIDELEARIRLSAERIEQLMAAQRDISDHIAHETRTPLMVLGTHIRTALECSDDPAVTAPLHAAGAQIRDLLRLLDALLDIASAEAQRGDLSGLGVIDLSAVARSIGELYAASAEEARLELRLDIEDSVMVRADAMQMSRLIVNLLDNAFKYGRDGRFIALSLRVGPVIAVEDDGPGIADADLDRVLTRYGRAGDNGQKGHGLGLPLVRAIAARHGLGLQVMSGETSGARFQVAPPAIT